MNRSQTSLRLQENPEFQTSVTRFIIWSIAFGYMHGPELGDVYTTLFWVFFAVYVLVFASLFIVPVSILRRYFTIFIDIVGASIVIHGSGDAGDPLLLIYVWIYVGYGFRYGAHYLLAAAVVTMLGYSAVVYALHAWEDEPVQIALAVLILGLLPLYQYSLQKKLEQAKESAEKADRVKTEFLATMSHTLRTPLTTVLGMGQLLAGESLTGRSRDYLKSLLASAGTLQTQIQNVLDLARIGAQELRLHLAPFHLDHMLQDVVRAMAPEAEKKGLSLRLWVSPRLPSTVMGDELRLRQIVHHLTDNAVKFTEKGEVRLRLRWNAETDPPQALLTVEDTGIGIPSRDLQYLYERFWQGETTGGRHTQGVGLGTALSRELVQLMGGSIDVDSMPGVGTRFDIVIPFEGDLAGPAPRRKAKYQNCNVAILTPNAFEAGMIADYCGYLGCRTTQVNPDSAAESDPAVDLVILGDACHRGADVIREEVSKRFGAATPLISVCRGADDETAGAALRAPFLVNDLEDALEGVWKRAATPKETPRASEPPVSAAVLRGARVLLVEDDPDISMLVRVLLEAQGCDVTNVENGFLGLEQLETNRFDCAIVDLRMPGMDGRTVAREWRKREAETGRLPVALVALTAETLDSVREDALDAGMNEFLHKPIDPPRLLQAIQEQLRARASAAGR